MSVLQASSFKFQAEVLLYKLPSGRSVGPHSQS